LARANERIPSHGSTVDADRRKDNDRLAERAVSLHFETDLHVPFVCECGDPTCGVSVPTTLPDYRDLRRSGDALLAPNHLARRVEDARRTAESLSDSAAALKHEAAQARKWSSQRRETRRTEPPQKD
jgi:hypothetical protein